MAVDDSWYKTGPDGTRTPSRRHGRGLRWRVRWYEGGQQRSKSFRTKGEADRFDLERQTRPVRRETDLLVDQLAESLLAAKGGKAAKTREMYGNGVRHVLAQFSGRQAGSLAPSEIRIWIGGLRKADGQPASDSLRQQVMLALSSMYDLAIDDGLLDRNPCAKITVVRQDEREPRYLTMPQLVKLAHAAGPYELMVLFMGMTGVRIGEACALRVGSIDLGRGRVRIHRSRGATGEGRTKTRKSRDVPLPASLAVRLSESMRGRRPDDYLFLSPQGHPVNSHNWRERVFHPAAWLVWLDGLHPHDLRHTAVSLAIKGGADIKVVQRIAGHASLKQTDRYSHLFDDQLDVVGARMDAEYRIAAGLE